MLLGELHGRGGAAAGGGFVDGGVNLGDSAIDIGYDTGLDTKARLDVGTTAVGSATVGTTGTSPQGRSETIQHVSNGGSFPQKQP